MTAITMGLNGSAAHARASQALSSMLSRNALNPADITNLYKLYSAADPPPVELIRIPQFMGLLGQSFLFRIDTQTFHEMNKATGYCIVLIYYYYLILSFFFGFQNCCWIRCSNRESS